MDKTPPANITQSQILQQQNKLFKKQDEQIDLLLSSLTRVKNIAQDIGTELQEQNKLLDDLTYQTEATTHRINRQNKRITKLTKSKGLIGWIFGF
jgi:uncharacterized membrane-anchored protein YjiN (DUF445 family)